ncbi:hypothetical protein ACH4PU_30880 [Streptomyces sp. NPDC021100]|uniref:hypothetical protein n=1 Tax=Streptomyces sp. NPDC021100 TaxID=3365114 RepID=UPI0037B79FA1
MPSLPDDAAQDGAAFVPGRPLTLASPDPSFTIVARLDPSLISDSETARAVFADWSRDQLYALVGILMDEGNKRNEKELLELLRWLCESHPEAVKVEFVTEEYEDGVFWDDTFYVHRANGTVVRYEWPEETDQEWEERADQYIARLSDYTMPPVHGAHLTVDLATGEFDISGKWSLV